MKRVLTFILMTAVLLLSLLVPVGAEHVDDRVTDRVTKAVPLWNADETWGGRYVTDTENQVEGEGCISINLNGVTGTLAPAKKLDPVDATGTCALEFDMYISDLAILGHLQAVTSGSFEICSSGACDQGEKNFSLSALAKKLKQGCPRVGWNHVVLRFADMNETQGSFGPFTPSNVNYIRLYWTGMTDCGQDWILKFDNFVLTDREVEPDPHTPGEWQYDENQHWRSCTGCDKKIDESVHAKNPQEGYACEEEFTCYACKQVCEALPHAFTEQPELVKPATCTQAALYHCRCARCGEMSKEPMEMGEKAQHSPSERYHSCGADGHAILCENCGENVGKLLPHYWGEWTIQKEPTETEEGLQERACQRCPYSETEVIPKTESGKSGCAAVMGGMPILAVIALGALVIRKKK